MGGGTYAHASDAGTIHPATVFEELQADGSAVLILETTWQGVSGEKGAVKFKIHKCYINSASKLEGSFNLAIEPEKWHDWSSTKLVVGKRARRAQTLRLLPYMNTKNLADLV